MLELPPPDPVIEITLAGRGYSKGLAQTDGPQVVVRPELLYGAIHVGGYAKNVTSSSLDGEGGPVIGFRTNAGGFGLAGSATLKLAIAPVGDVDDAAVELAASVARAVGPVSARLGVAWSADDIGSTGRSIYWDGTAGYRLGRSTSLGAGLSRRERDGGPDYTAFNLGVTRTLVGGVSADLRWYDTDRSALGDAFEGRLVLALRARF
jgi:hypothetical protein